MQHNRPEGCATHPGIRHPDHVLYAFRRELFRNWQVAGFRHAWRPLWPSVLHHQDIVWTDIKVRVVNAVGKILLVLEYHRLTDMVHQMFRCSRLFNDRAIWRQIAAQHGDTALRVKGVVERPHHILIPWQWRCIDLLAQSAASNGHTVEMQLWTKLAQYSDKTARLLQILHVVLAGRLKVNQHRRLLPHSVERLEIDLDTEPPSDCRHVDQAVGRTADRQQHTEGVGKSLRRHYLLRHWAFRTHFNRPPPGCFRMAQPVCRNSWDSSTPRHHHAESLCHAGHSTGRAHHHAGARRRRELATDLVDL